MNNILIFSQDGEFTVFARSIARGQRQENRLIGDKLQALLDSKKMTKEELIKKVGNSYNDAIIRILNNQEIPKPKIVEKIINLFELDDDYFKDKNLQNVIITDGGVVVGKYSTDDKALKIKRQLDGIIEDAIKTGNPIILHIPME